jgi:O-antigen/teichoic acid export membrane protein
MVGRSLYVFSAKMVGYAIRLTMPIALVRLLTKAEFGGYRQFFLIETLIAMIFAFGVNQALYYFIPRDRKNAGSYYLNCLLLNVATFGTAFIVVSFVRQPVSEFLKMPVLAEQFWQVSLYTTMIMLIVATDSYLLARQKVRQSAFFEIGGQILTSAVTLAAAFATRRLDLILTAIAVARAGQALIMLGYVHWGLHGFAATRYFFDIWPQIRYGLVLGFAGTLFTLLLRMHEVVVSSRFGPEVYAVYSAGCTHIPFLNFYLQGIAAVSLGRFAELVKHGDTDGIRRLWNEIMVSLFSVAVPITLFLVAIAEPLIVVMFTERYADAVSIFRVHALMRFALVWNASLVLRALGRNDILLYINIAALILGVPILLVGISAFGLIGAIASEFLLVLLARVAGLVILNRISGLGLQYGILPRDALGFYLKVWRKGLGLVRDRFRSSSNRSAPPPRERSLGKRDAGTK